MAEGDGKKRKSSKMLLLGGALAAAAAAGAYLSDCIPGMNLGAGSGSDAPAEDREKDEEAEKAVDPNAPVAVRVVKDQCAKADDELGDCDALCKDLIALDPPREIVIDGAEGVHKTVTDLVDCLETAKLSVIAN